MMIILLCLTIPLLIILLYLGLLFMVHDFKCCIKDIKKDLGIRENYRVLSIFPHPDDEIMFAGGLLRQLSNNNDIHIKHVSITKGENGNERIKCSCEELGEIRKKELEKALKIIGIKDWEAWDFPDGGVSEKYIELVQRISTYINQFKPDLIVTLERRGMYGHPDHVALSKAIHEVQQNEFKNIKVLYSTLPKKILSKAKLPEHMSKDRRMRSALPEFRINIIPQLPFKYLAARKYRSQNLNHGAPLWVKAFLGIYEYYTTKYN